MMNGRVSLYHLIMKGKAENIEDKHTEMAKLPSKIQMGKKKRPKFFVESSNIHSNDSFRCNKKPKLVNDRTYSPALASLPYLSHTIHRSCTPLTEINPVSDGKHNYNFVSPNYPKKTTFGAVALAMPPPPQLSKNVSQTKIYNLSIMHELIQPPKAPSFQNNMLNSSLETERCTPLTHIIHQPLSTSLSSTAAVETQEETVLDAVTVLRNHFHRKNCSSPLNDDLK